jgi:carboxyl-terminal processing protease
LFIGWIKMQDLTSSPGAPEESMRGSLSYLALCLSGGLILAAGTPVPDNKAKVPPVAPSIAQNYAQQLFQTLQQVEQGYIKPISRYELAHAALGGLYEAIRQPVPRELAAEVQKVGTDQELMELLMRVRVRLGDIEPLAGNAALIASIQALPRALDPHSGLVSGDELRRGTGEMPPRSFGLEVADNGGVGPVLVDKVTPGGPAQRAGVRPGDQITHINGEAVEGHGYARALGAQVEAGQDPSAVIGRFDLTLRRPGVKDARKVRLSAESFRAETILGVNRLLDNSWNYWLDREQKIAQVRIGQIGYGTAETLQEVVNQLKNDGLRGLVLDLRWCPGGYLTEAVGCARLFLKEGNIATVQYRARPQDDEYKSDNEEAFVGFPLIVLVNGETSGAGEMIAAALQDNQRGLVFGQRTLGKASVQTMLHLSVPNTGLKLTSGTFLRPNGKSIHRAPDSKPSDDWGIRPEPGLEYLLAPDLNKQLRDWWHLQTLRPGASDEALPLDDPENDPQRQAAVKEVVKRIKAGEKQARR